MLQKFKITSCAFILVLFGFSLMTVSPVLAHNAVAFDEGDHTYEYEEAAVDDAEGTKEALKLQIEEISASLKDKDATIADLQNAFKDCILESKAQVELIADLQLQLATAIERADELLTGQDEVGRTQSSPGLWYDEASEYCRTDAMCDLFLEQFTSKNKSFEVWQGQYSYLSGEHDQLMKNQDATKMRYISYLLSVSSPRECLLFDFGCLEEQAASAAAWVLYLGNAAGGD